MLGCEAPNKHRYGTRATNNLHPAAAVGLAKRTKADVAADAAAKKDTVAKRQADKTEKQNQKTQRELEGMRRLAALEDERGREDCIEQDYLDHSAAVGFLPSSGDERDVANKGISTSSEHESDSDLEADLDGTHKVDAHNSYIGCRFARLTWPPSLLVAPPQASQCC